MTDRNFYSVVQYVPDTTAGERVNIGIVILAEDGSVLDVAFDDPVRRARRLDSTVSPAFFRRVEERLRNQVPATVGQQSLLAFDDVGRFHEDSHFAVQFTEPRGSSLSVGELRSRVMGTYLLPLPIHKRAMGAHVIRALVRRAFVDAGVDALLSPNVQVTGLHDTYSYDFGLQNGQLRGLVETLSFSKADEALVREGIYAAAYRVQDLRAAELVVPITMIAGGTDQNEPLFATATAIMASADAAVVPIDRLEPWVHGVARTLAAHE